MMMTIICKIWKMKFRLVTIKDGLSFEFSIFATASTFKLMVNVNFVHSGTV